MGKIEKVIRIFWLTLSFVFGPLVQSLDIRRSSLFIFPLFVLHATIFFIHCTNQKRKEVLLRFIAVIAALQPQRLEFCPGLSCHFNRQRLLSAFHPFEVGVNAGAWSQLAGRGGAPVVFQQHFEIKQKSQQLETKNREIELDRN